jgi:tetratricopeptide (TPR) repeat protein
MNHRFLNLILVWLLVLGASLAVAQTTNVVIVTNDSALGAMLQIQEQLHATRLQIEAGRAQAAETAQKSADAVSTRLQLLEQSVQNQRAAEMDAARKTQQLTLMLAGVFGLIGLGVMLLMIYFQWRSFKQIADISTQQNLFMAQAGAVHQLTAPPRNTVEISNSRLLSVVGQLEHKIRSLENNGGSNSLPQINSSSTPDPLADGQKLLDAGEAQKALDLFEKLLATQPDNASAMLKKAAALEKMARLEEALEFCDRALKRDRTQTVAFLQKGGLLNKLNRHTEALDCFEQALHTQDKNGKPA